MEINMLVMKKLILSVALILLHCIATKAQTWDSLGAGTDNAVLALAVYNNSLYAGGAFDSAGNIGANKVASWNGFKWDSLEDGIDVNMPLISSVFSLCNYSGSLFTGGELEGANHIPLKGIAQWNGVSWDSVLAGINGKVYALAVYNGELYAGGNFLKSGNTTVSNIARWNGTSWSPVGIGITTGFAATVYSLAVYNGSLYAGGIFSMAGGNPAISIAKWNDTNWSSVGSGMNVYSTVYALAVYNGNLYAGGNFAFAGGVFVHNIAQWNGSAWSKVDSGTNKVVRALCVYGSDLIAGGAFDTAGGKHINDIASWDGTSWDSLGVGINGTVYALCDYSGGLYAGGLFSKAGNLNANNIAVWRSPLAVNNLKTENDFKIFPNPNKGIFTIQSSVNSGEATVEIYNVLGEKVLKQILRSTQDDKVMDMSSQPSGVYFYRVLNNIGGLVGEGKFVKQ